MLHGSAVVYDMVASASVLTLGKAGRRAFILSTGLGSIREMAMRDDLPLIPSPGSPGRELAPHPVFCRRREEMVDRLVAVTGKRWAT